MADFRLSRHAESDLDSIAEYTELKYGPRQADTYTAQLRGAVETVAEFPSLGISYETRGGRMFRKYNSGQHALFYLPADDGIVIVRILHVAMDFDRHLDGPV